MLSKTLKLQSVIQTTKYIRQSHSILNNRLNEHVKVVAVPHSTDCYSYVIVNQSNLTCVAIDCGDSEVLANAIDKQACELLGVLSTHSHPNHCQGNKSLKTIYPKVPFFGSDCGLLKDTNTDIIKVGDSFKLEDFSFKILDGSCHSEDSIMIEINTKELSPMIFTGDTLCYASTGNLIIGKEKMLYDFIYDTLKDYPLSTSLFFGHEQSYKSLKFEKFMEPYNRKIIFDQKGWVKTQLRKAVSTSPTTIEKELQHNPFFRAECPEFQQYMKINDPYELFKVVYDRRIHYDELKRQGFLGKFF